MVCFIIYFIKLCIDAPDSCDAPGWLVLDFLSETLYMHVDGAGVADIFIAHMLSEEALLPCKHLMIWRQRQENISSKLLRRHINLLSVISDRVVGQIYNKPRYSTLIHGNAKYQLCRLEASEHMWLLPQAPLSQRAWYIVVGAPAQA